jgi:CBS domain containing-hemolysin-like protein
MIGIMSGIVCILLALLALVLQRLYSSIPARELKRLARRGDHLAVGLFRPVAYGTSLRLLLWIVAVGSLSAGLLLTTPHLPAVANLALLAVLLVVALVWSPSLRLTVHTAQFAALLSPSVTWILRHMQPLLSRAAATINTYRSLVPHSLLYEKEDLQQLLARQKEQADNRIEQQELETAERALAFGDRHAADIVRPYRNICLVNADDALGPILLDQLHKSGQSSFLVYKDTKDNIIGSLSLRDAVNAKHDGRVLDLIRNDLTYVHEDFSLRQVLAAFQKTGQHLAVVVNSFEEFVGVITFDAVLKELLGDMPDDATEQYENRTVIAAYKPKKTEDPASGSAEEARPSEAIETHASSTEATEVVE